MDANILLIDGDDELRKSLSILFRSQGYHFEAFETAENAMTVIHQKKWNIILCDYALPGINGLLFFKKIRLLNPNIIRIMMIEHNSNEVISEAKNIGITYFIEKPFTTKTIIGSLQGFIKKHRAENSQS